MTIDHIDIDKIASNIVHDPEFEGCIEHGLALAERVNELHAQSGFKRVIRSKRLAVGSSVPTHDEIAARITNGDEASGWKIEPTDEHIQLLAGRVLDLLGPRAPIPKNMEVHSFRTPQSWTKAELESAGAIFPAPSCNFGPGPSTLNPWKRLNP